MKKHRYIVAIGSNIQPEENIATALNILTQEQCLLSYSTFQKTAPVGFQDQDDFLNGAAYIESKLGYEQFNLYLKGIEKRLKRVKGPIKSGPRTIDLDIIIHNCKIVDSDFSTADYIRKPIQELIKREDITLQNENG